MSVLIAVSSIGLTAFAAQQEPTVTVGNDVYFEEINYAKTVYPGQNFNLNYVVSDLEKADGSAAILEISGLSANGIHVFENYSPFYQIKISSQQNAGYIALVADTFASGTKELTLTLRYFKGSVEYNNSTTISINTLELTDPEPPADPEYAAPVLTLSNFSLSSEEVEAGSTFTVLYSTNFQNFYNYADGTITVSGDGFSLSGVNAEVPIIGTQYLSVYADKSLQSGRYPLKITASYTDTKGESHSCERTINVNIIGADGNTGDGFASFTMTSASIPEKTGKPNLSTNLTARFTNTSQVTAKDVSVKLSGFGDALLNTYTDTVNIGNVEAGEDFKAVFPIKISENTKEQITLTATVSYMENGEVKTSDFNIYLTSSVSENGSSTISGILTPKVIVSKYSVDKEPINSGDEFTLTFYLKNTSTQVEVKNMTVDVTPKADTNGSSVVFSPVSGSSSFYTASLAKNSESEYSIVLKTNAAAGTKSYPVTISYTYEYANGGAYEQGQGSMDINLAVVQPIKFELSDWYPPTECYGWDGCSISFTYYNKSKNPMTNLSIAMEGDFTMQENYVGSLPASSYDSFSGFITPVDGDAVGETKQAILVFKFEDASGNEQRVEYPFDVTIMEPMTTVDPGIDDMPIMPSEPVDGDIDGENGGFPIWAWFAIGGGAVVIIVVIAVIVVKKKKSAVIEDDDDDDEE